MAEGVFQDSRTGKTDGTASSFAIRGRLGYDDVNDAVWDAIPPCVPAIETGCFHPEDGTA